LLAEESDAIDLFLDKVRPGWAPSDRDRELIAEIVARLDRIPLAIELAAARARSVPLDLLAQHLKDDLSLLDRGFVDAPQRYRTLGAAIAWSVSRLDDAERSALYAASCFHQPFDAEAIAYVLDAPALHLMQVLRDRSLLYEPEPGSLFMYSAIQHFVRCEPRPELDARFEELVVNEARSGRIRREELAAVVAGSTAIERVLEAALHLSLRDLIPGRSPARGSQWRICAGSGARWVRPSCSPRLRWGSMPSSTRALASCWPGFTSGAAP
jgi:hypothetical protein